MNYGRQQGEKKGREGGEEEGGEGKRGAPRSAQNGWVNVRLGVSPSWE